MKRNSFLEASGLLKNVAWLCDDNILMPKECSESIVLNCLEGALVFTPTDQMLHDALFHSRITRLDRRAPRSHICMALCS